MTPKYLIIYILDHNRCLKSDSFNLVNADQDFSECEYLTLLFFRFEHLTLFFFRNIAQVWSLLLVTSFEGKLLSVKVKCCGYMK